MNKNCDGQYNAWLHWFAVLTAVGTFVLLGAGGLVTSHDAGMSVPDWPNSYGYGMYAFPASKWVGGIFYEHTHRLWASAVGLMTTILALWLFGKNARSFMRWMGATLAVAGIVIAFLISGQSSNGAVAAATGIVMCAAGFVWPRCNPAAKWLRWLGLGAFLLVVVQGVLGGLRVVLFNADLGAVHGVVGQLFFLLTCALALFTSRSWQAGVNRAADYIAGGRPFRALPFAVLAATALIVIQLILGATMRGQHAGLAIPDFPLAYGKLWPDTSAAAILHYNAQRIEVMHVNPITAFQVILQMVHRLVALTIFVLVAACAMWAHRLEDTGAGSLKTQLRFHRRISLFWVALIVCQIALGAATIWTHKAADVATAHLLGGALCLATGALWSIVLFARPWILPEPYPATASALGALATK
ncbi:MAG: COX15/CtaA family protein [Verrucomicrobia bacterium]|nr:COX15/CtaA family protein [Verrucomicrobiota bacterium]MDE3099827.1 COX15/CtaA family protein [Verrucomicrobiota bacterium]